MHTYIMKMARAFIDPEDEKPYRILRKVADEEMFEEDVPFQPPFYLRTTGEMLEEFSYLGEKKAYEVVVKNPRLISESCGHITPVKEGKYYPVIENAENELKEIVSKHGIAYICPGENIGLSKAYNKALEYALHDSVDTSKDFLMLLDEVNNNTIIKAGQTFVAKCQKSDVVFENCSDVTFDDSTPNPTPSKVKIYNFDGTSGALTQNTDVNLKIGGTYSNLTKLDKNNYCTLVSNGSFDSTTSVEPFQMYVYMESNGSVGSKITSISFDFNDETTGIKELRMTNDNSTIYDINGRKVKEKNLKPGFYIKNGKKVVMK